MSCAGIDWDPFGMSDRWETGELRSSVDIEPGGLWSWHLVLSYDCMECGRWVVIGSRRRADRVARRKLLAFRRRNNRARSHRGVRITHLS